MPGMEGGKFSFKFQLCRKTWNRVANFKKSQGFQLRDPWFPSKLHHAPFCFVTRLCVKRLLVLCHVDPQVGGSTAGSKAIKILWKSWNSVRRPIGFRWFRWIFGNSTTLDYLRPIQLILKKNKFAGFFFTRDTHVTHFTPVWFPKAGFSLSVSNQEARTFNSFLAFYGIRQDGCWEW